MEAEKSSAIIDENGKRRFRKVPPLHYTFEIESFSLLLETNVGKYETKEFEAGGYQWRMVLYPNGKNTKEHGNRRHMSLFLAMTDPDHFSFGWEVNVTVNFFVFDGIRDRYLAIQDPDRMDWRFHKMKLAWGFDEFLSHDMLRDPSNGFLVDDRCVFGVEVFVMECSCAGESLSFVKQPESGLFTWKINNFQAMNKSSYYSKVFTVEGRGWKLMLYPKGDLEASVSGTHLSLYLLLDDSDTLQTRQKLYAEFILRIRDHKNHNHCEAEIQHWFDTPGHGFGCAMFMPLSTLNDPSNDYLVNDCLIIEAAINVVSVIKDLA